MSDEDEEEGTAARPETWRPVEATWESSIELELEADAKRRLRRALVVSALAHVLVVLLLMLRPAPEPIVLPPAITVDLVAAPPSAPAAKPAPAPAAKPAPAPASPQPRLLPKTAPSVVAKPVPKPKPEPIRRRPRPKELELGDAMAALRAELGEEAAPVLTETAASEPIESASASSGDAGAGAVQVSPELLKWIADTKQHIRTVSVNPPDFVGKGLQTTLRVQLRADGEVVGQPEVVGSSGDPFADDNAVRALMKSSPLPAPPQAGAQIFVFIPEAPR
jgi:outer membrane biosynthesis protein TonB